MNGWINERRGARVIAESLEQLNVTATYDVRLLLAGQLEDDAARELAARPDVDYIGRVENYVALSLYRTADLVLTLYDPSLPINRYAYSNKWGDCIAMHVPFLVNSEVRTATEYLLKGIAWSVPFNEPTEQANAIKSLILDRDVLHRASAAAERISSQRPDFDTQFRDAVISGLSRTKDLFDKTDV